MTDKATMSVSPQLAQAVERLETRLRPLTATSLPSIAAADIRIILDGLKAAEVERDAANARWLALRAVCQPFAKAWALARRTFVFEGKLMETADRKRLGLSEEGSLQIGDFGRLVRVLNDEYEREQRCLRKGVA